MLRLLLGAILLLQLVLGVLPSAAAAAGPDDVADELIVVLRPERHAEAKDIHRKAGGALVRQLGLRPIQVVKVTAGTRDRVRQAYRADPRVQSVEPNGRVHAAALPAVPSDPQFGQQWGLPKIEAPAAWAGSEGTGVLVGVVDTGIDASHPDLQGQIAASANFSAAADVVDRNGHGTHVAGIIAARTNNALGVAGTAPGARLLIARALDDSGAGTYADVIEAMGWAVDQGAKVINLSLVGTTPSQALADAVQYAQDHGAVVVAAAGNTGSSTATYPASYPGVVSVAATDQSDAPTAITTFGTWVTLGAPGQSIVSTLPDGKYGALSGSSMAAAYVSGAAALAAAAGAADPSAIRSALIVGADPVGWRGIAYAAGRLNARRAVAAARPATPATATPTATPASLAVRVVGSGLSTSPPGLFLNTNVAFGGTGMGGVSFVDGPGQVTFRSTRLTGATVDGTLVRVSGVGVLRGSTAESQFQLVLKNLASGFFGDASIDVNGSAVVGYHADFKLPAKRFRAIGLNGAGAPPTATPTGTPTPRATPIAATGTATPRATPMAATGTATRAGGTATRAPSTPTGTATPRATPIAATGTATRAPSTATVAATRTRVSGNGGGTVAAASGSVTITVTDSLGAARSGQVVFSYNGTTFTNIGTTNGSGQVSAVLVDATYSFRTTYNGVQFFSNATPNCVVPGCTAAAITVNAPTQLTVQDDAGAPLSGLTVTAYNGATNTNMGVTNGSGQVAATLASNTYAFRATYNSQIFWAGGSSTPSCAVPTCTSATVVANRPIVVTVVDDGGAAQSNLTVQAYDGTSYTAMGTSNGAGQVTRSLSTGTYTFRASYGGVWYYSNATPNCATPGCTAATVTVASPVTVTVADNTGTPLANLPIYVYNGTTYVKLLDTTDSAGRGSGNIAVGSYRFATDYSGTRFYSAATNTCTIIGCANASISVPAPVRVTVLDDAGAPVANAQVQVYNDATFVRNMPGLTDASGQITAAIAAGNYRFADVYNGTRFYSAAANHCTIPGCANAQVTVNRPSTVTVVDNLGQPQTGLAIAASNGTSTYNMGATNAAGQVAFSLLNGTYRFRATYNGNLFWSAASPNCAVPGCFSGSITVNAPSTVTVVNGAGAAVPNVPVWGYDGTSYISMGSTDSVGNATASLPTGTYSFRTLYQGTYFFSNPTPNCAVPSCAGGSITVNPVVTVTVTDNLGAPQQAVQVWSYNGTTYVSMGVTNSVGQVSMALTTATYSFRASYYGSYFFSNPAPNCAVPSCTSGAITVNQPVSVTVVDGSAAPQPNLQVAVYNGTTFVSNLGITNASGVGVGTAATGTYRFGVTYAGVTTYSNPTNNCAIPGCTSATITVTAPTPTPVPGGFPVTVVNSTAQVQPNLLVQSSTNGTTWTNFATTNGSGVATKVLANATYNFRTLYQGTYFTSNATPNCTTPGCTSATITVSAPTTVTVVDSTSAPQANLTVWSYNGTSYVSMGTTDAAGRVSGALTAATYSFRTQYNGTYFFSNPTPNCAVPSCSTATITVSAPVTVTVQDTSSVVQPGVTIWSYNGTSYTSLGTTNASGQLVASLASGTYSFRTQYNGGYFYSNSTPNCTVPGCSTASITVLPPTTVTVVDTNGSVQPNLSVVATDGTTNTTIGTTNPSGQVDYSLAAGTYTFRTTYVGNTFYSNPTPNCTVPACRNATISVDAPVTITVTDVGGNPAVNVTVQRYNGTAYTTVGATDAAGQVTTSPPVGTYSFRASYGGTWFSSNPTPNCVVPGCTSAAITVSSPVTVSVLDNLGNPQSGLTVLAYDGAAYTTVGVTNASGLVTKALPAATYNFRTTYNGVFAWSNATPNCTTPGCTTGTITVVAPTMVTVVDTNGTAQANLVVNAFDGTTTTNMGTTTGLGQVSASLPAGTYLFRATYNGTTYNSNPTPNCTVPTCTSGTVTVTAATPIPGTPTFTPTPTSTPTPGGATLSAAPGSTGGNGAVTVSWSGIAGGTGSDWIAMYAVGATNSAYLGWQFVNCTQTAGSAVAAGSCVFTMPAGTGSYEFRLFSNNTYTRLATSNTVAVAGATATATATTTPTSTPTGAALTFSASPASLAGGAVATVSWANIASPTGADWMALYTPGAANTAYLAMKYVNCAASPGAAVATGSCGFTMPTSNGIYELRLFSNNTYSLLATSNQITVTGPTPTNTPTSTPTSTPTVTNTAVPTNTSTPTATAVSSDAFTRPDGAGLGPGWETDGSPFGICSNQACLTVPGSASYARVNTGLLDQKVSITIGAGGFSGQLGLITRVTADWNTYHLWVGIDSTGRVEVWKLINATWTGPIATGNVTPSYPLTLRSTTVGTSMAVSVNSTTVPGLGSVAVPAAVAGATYAGIYIDATSAGYGQIDAFSASSAP